jgi:hypothetical protein
MEAIIEPGNHGRHLKDQGRRISSMAQWPWPESCLESRNASARGKGTKGYLKNFKKQYN